MKKLKFRKVIASTLVAVSLISLNPIGASAAWEYDNSGWSYKEGNSYANGWKQIDGKWYYFGYLEYMVYDTWVDGYYLDPNGVWTKNANYTINDIGKEGIITGKSGKQYGRAAGFKGICGIINGEPCLTTYTKGYNNEVYTRYIGFNTLNIYDENNNVVDTVRLL